MFNDKELMHNQIFLSGKSEITIKEDPPVALDLACMLCVKHTLIVADKIKNNSKRKSQIAVSYLS